MQSSIDAGPLGIRRVTLSSYGGVEVRTDVCTPTDEAHLARCLLYATQQGRHLSFRSGGRAFDTQSLNDDLVVCLERLRAITVNAHEGTVTVGPGATWGSILQATALEGFVPYVMVTSSRAAAGGTVSADSLSRFTPAFGTEGAHVRSLRLMRLDGTVIRCSRTENAETFRAVVGGLGYLGAVVEITHALHRLPFRAPRIAVETDLRPCRGFDALEAALANDGPAATAISVVVRLEREPIGFVMRSRYVECDPGELRPTMMHQPSSPVHLFLQVLASFELGRRIGWKVFLALILREPRLYVDDLAGFTFFQDGNERVKQVGRAMGFPLGTRQQSFFVPRGTLRVFLEETRACLDTSRIEPALIDILRVPPKSSPSLLSSSAGEEGFIVSVAFEHLLRRDLTREEGVLRAISHAAGGVGGRVHLMKHVYADRDVLARMYPAVEELRAQKAALDPTGTLDNEFLHRALPGLF